MTLFVGHILGLLGLSRRFPVVEEAMESFAHGREDLGPVARDQGLGPVLMDAGAGEKVAAERSRAQTLALGERAADGSVWCELSRSGIHLSPIYEGRIVNIPRAAVEEMVDIFPSMLEDGWHGQGRGIPMRADPNHSFGFFGRDDSLLAVGQILELRAVEIEGLGELSLQGRVKWNAEGERIVKSGLLWTTSIEFWFPGTLNFRNGPNKGEPIPGHVMTGCVLTNDPMVSDMVPVAASWRAAASRPAADALPTPPVPPAAASAADPNPTTENSMGFKALLLSALCLGEDATEADIVARISANAKDAEKLAVLETNLATVEKDRDALATELSGMKKAHREALFAQAIEDTRCSPADEADFMDSLEKLGEAATLRAYRVGRVKTERASREAHGLTGDAAKEAAAKEAAAAARAAEMEQLSPLERHKAERAAEFARTRNTDPSAEYQDKE